MSSKRFFARLSIVIILSVTLGSGCLPRQIKPVDSIDPGPFLQLVQERQAAFEKGLSGTLELAFKNRNRRFNSKAYIVAYPDGRFRMEIPGPFGNTYLVMASDNREIMVFYPGENRAIRSSVTSRSLNRHLPFPLPVEPEKITALILGVLPRGGSSSGAQAHLMDSGEKLLQAGTEDGGLRYEYLFEKAPENRLQTITVKGTEMEVLIYTQLETHSLPENFKITFSEGFIKGEWDSIKPFAGDDSILRLHIPDSIPITDLRTLP